MNSVRPSAGSSRTMSGTTARSGAAARSASCGAAGAPPPPRSPAEPSPRARGSGPRPSPRTHPTTHGGTSISRRVSRSAWLRGVAPIPRAGSANRRARLERERHVRGSRLDRRCRHRWSSECTARRGTGRSSDPTAAQIRPCRERVGLGGSGVVAGPRGCRRRVAGTCDGARRRRGRSDVAVQQGDAHQVPEDTERKVGTDAHPGAAHVVPHDRDDGDRVAATAREVDDLRVEDDPGGPLPTEEVAPDIAPEALEATLRIRHVPGDPGSRDAAGRRGRASVDGTAGWHAGPTRRAGCGSRARRRGRRAPR